MNVAGKSFYIQTQLWAGHNGNKEKLCEALKESGFAEYVAENFNTQSLSALVREIARDIESDVPITVERIVAELPTQVREHIKISEVTRLKARKGS